MVPSAHLVTELVEEVGVVVPELVVVLVVGVVVPCANGYKKKIRVTVPETGTL